MGFAQESSTYRVGSEDTISVLVARHPEFSGDFLVPSDGCISLPAIGQVHVSGMTLVEISENVASRLKSRLKDPEVSVTLRSAGMQRVYVLGSVQKPGLYDLKPGWRITHCVAAAGGLGSGCEPNDCTATVVRYANGKRETVQMRDAMQGLDLTNLSIESGDVVMIESRETMPVYVTGKVKSPGIYRVNKDHAGVMEALTLAGGTLENSALDRVTVISSDNTTRTVDLNPLAMNGKQEPNITIKPGDLIVVPEDVSKVAVLGYVNKPGFYSIRRSEKLLLSDALGLAGGSDRKRGEVGSIALIRNENGMQTRTMYDMSKFLKSGDLTQNPTINAGDIIYVPQTRKPDWDFVMRSLTTVAILMNPFIP
ncbi:SLBB domain-containing protein [bacterium]|nr:SLBB domain-containing protein [bacterium]